MRICIYEDSQATNLEPIALTRPALALWCGAERLFERLLRQFGSDDVGFWIRPALVDLWKLDHPNHPINDTNWLRAQPTLWLNGRWLAAPDVHIEASSPHVGSMNGQVAYAALPAAEAPPAASFDAWLADWQQRLPQRAVSGAMLDYLWDVVDHNGTALIQDAQWFRAAHGARSLPQIAIVGPTEDLLVAQDASIEPYVFADTRGGPVLIDRGAVVQAFSRLEGPCYVGRESWIVAARLRAGSSIGPWCRIGGEVEASIVQGYSNKYHEGFLGHSYLGEWVNLAAATQTSDLRNDYDMIRVGVNGQRVATGKTKIGSYIGDHAKTGLSALLNTGSTIGAFANVLPSGSLLPPVIPSFCQVQQGELREMWDLRKTFATAGRVMQRRGKTLTDIHRDFYDRLFEATSQFRRRTMREGEMRRLKRGV